MSVLFPKISKLTVHGFSNIFSKNDFEIDLSDSLSIILGGNGLGKTTLLQCIVYGLTGGTDDINAEDLKIHRWNHNYFKGRVNDDSYIILEFFLGDTCISVKRAFNSSRVLDYAINNNETTKSSKYEDAIIKFGRYSNISDFYFIINRLLYLPENRRSLIWDYDAQIRTLMIISDEIVREEDYRELRKLIKEKDSNKRRIHWELGRLEKKKSNTKRIPRDAGIEANSYIEKKKKLLAKLQSLSEENRRLNNTLIEHKNTRKELATSISSISDEIRSIEAKYLSQLLAEHDEKHALLFANTLKNGHCPACNQKSDNLKNIIVKRIQSCACLLCGEEIHEQECGQLSGTVDDLISQLHEKVSARNSLDLLINQLQYKIVNISNDISTVREDILSLDSHNKDNLISSFLDEDEEYTDDYIDGELVNLSQIEKELESEIIRLTGQANELHDTFINDFQNRLELLQHVYSELAYKFLGIPVALKYAQSNAKFVNLDYLIPVFSDIERPSPDSCSEAQRFFLDIAFRMSVIALNRKLSDSRASFICETPENALDASYVDNVVHMFIGFMENGNNLILTNNLQYNGIAQIIVKNSIQNKIEFSIFDLLEYGKLSEIQTSSEQLSAIRDIILSEVDNGQ